MLNVFQQSQLVQLAPHQDGYIQATFEMWSPHLVHDDVRALSRGRDEANRICIANVSWDVQRTHGRTNVAVYLHLFHCFTFWREESRREHFAKTSSLRLR